MPDLTPFSDLQEITAAIHRRQVSPVELIRTTLDAISRHNSALNAYITVCDETALAAAERLEKSIGDGKEVGPLAGIPISVKDLILTKDAPTTAGSKVFGDGLPADEDAPVIKRLRKAGAIVVGKTNLHEVALGVTSVNEHFGPVRNPWALDRVAGGSSGGSAVAVAAGLCAASVGTDTRGSIRIPAACCGITGLKPTYGLLPNDLVIPLSPTLDHVGPMTRTVADAALMLGVMTGNKALLDRFVKALRASTRSLVVGISEYHMRDLDDSVIRAMEKAIRALRPLVREVREISIPELEGVQEASGVITASEAAAYHDVHLKRSPKSFGPLVRRRLEGGYKRTAVEYLNAVKVKREEVSVRFEEGRPVAFSADEIDEALAEVRQGVQDGVGTDTVARGDF